MGGSSSSDEHISSCDKDTFSFQDGYCQCEQLEREEQKYAKTREDKLNDREKRLNEQEERLKKEKSELIRLRQCISFMKGFKGEGPWGKVICRCGYDASDVILNDGGNSQCENCGFKFHWCSTNPPTFKSNSNGPAFCETCKSVKEKVKLSCTSCGNNKVNEFVWSYNGNRDIMCGNCRCKNVTVEE